MNTSHYPSLELCKKLTDLGFPMNKLIYHITNGGSLICNMDVYKLTNQKPPIGGVEYVCPSISELLDELPKGDISIRWVYPDWRVIHDSKNYGTRDEFLPNALALMWIRLKEDNYLTTK